MNPLLHRHKYVVVIIPIMIMFFMSCSYSSKKVDYPTDFKYASLTTEYSGIADSIKPIIADSIRASIARTGLILTPIDSLKGDSLLIVKVNVVNFLVTDAKNYLRAMMDLTEHTRLLRR